MGNFYTDVIKPHGLYSTLNTVRDLDLLEPVTRAAVRSVLTGARALGITLIVTETYRSQARQAMLFRQGLTRLENVGVHHYGLAADFAKVAKVVNGLTTWGGDWSFLRDLADEHGLISGLDWGHAGERHNFIDPDHVQRCTLAQQAELFAGRWYPADLASGGLIS